VALIVFGGAEREKAALILNGLTPAVRKAYHQATTYHDGKWLVLHVDRDEILEDIQILLGVKRRGITATTTRSSEARRNSSR
jgi:hypothetical protein